MAKSLAVTKDLAEVVGRARHLPRLARTHAAGRRVARRARRSACTTRDAAWADLLHLKFMGGTGRPSDVTDNTLSSVLVVLDRFKRGVLGNASQARRHPGAHPGPRAAPDRRRRAQRLAGRSDPGRSRRRQDLLRYADDAPVEPLRVCFQPFEGRVWVCGPNDLRAAARLQPPVRSPDACAPHRFVVSFAPRFQSEGAVHASCSCWWGLCRCAGGVREQPARLGAARRGRSERALGAR